MTTIIEEPFELRWMTAEVMRSQRRQRTNLGRTSAVRIAVTSTTSDSARDTGNRRGSPSCRAWCPQMVHGRPAALHTRRAPPSGAQYGLSRPSSQHCMLALGQDDRERGSDHDLSGGRFRPDRWRHLASCDEEEVGENRCDGCDPTSTPELPVAAAVRAGTERWPQLGRVQGYWAGFAYVDGILVEVRS